MANKKKVKEKMPEEHVGNRWQDMNLKAQMRL